VTYEDLPAVISIEDAIEANSYYEQYHGDSLISGDLEAGFAGEQQAPSFFPMSFVWLPKGRQALVV